MSITVNGAAVAPPVDSSTASTQKAAARTPAASAHQDTAQISSAAQAAAKAALQETTETPAQTAKEAQSGDPQAQRVLARYAAQHKT